MDETAAMKVISKNPHFFLGKIEAAWFNDIGVRELEDLICDPNHIRVRKYTKICQTLNSAHVLAIRPRTVHGPAQTLGREEVPTAKFRTAKILGNEPPPTARSIFGVGKPGEIEFRIIVHRHIRRGENCNENDTDAKQQ